MNKNIFIFVVDVNEVLVFIVFFLESVLENLKFGISVFIIIVIDFDVVQNLIFSLDDDVVGKFVVKSKVFCQIFVKGICCVIVLLVSSFINYEDIVSLEVIICVIDDKGFFCMEKFNLIVIDGNDLFINVMLDGSMLVFIFENSKNV